MIIEDKLRIAILQADLFWEDRQANNKYFENAIRDLKGETDLVVLPETFATGFTMNATEYAVPAEVTLNWMKKLAKENDLYLCGSDIIIEESKIFNRLFWVGPDAEINYYNKRHLFRMGREHEAFTAGNERKIVRLGEFRFLLQICYDLRFPVFARNRGDYDAIIYVANWPSPRKYAWESLLPARAIENQAWLIASNRCGIDGEGIECCGNSMIIDPKGKINSRLDDQPGIILSSISLNEVRHFQDSFPAQKDADTFFLNL